MPVDVSEARTAARHRRAATAVPPAERPLERAQLVWRRAVELAESSPQHDRFALALELLRVAHHGPAGMAHALNLGRTHLHAHPEDAMARDGAAILEAAIALLGVKPRVGDVAVARR